MEISRNFLIKRQNRGLAESLNLLKPSISTITLVIKPDLSRPMNQSRKRVKANSSLRVLKAELSKTSNQPIPAKTCIYKLDPNIEQTNNPPMNLRNRCCSTCLRRGSSSSPLNTSNTELPSRHFKRSAANLNNSMKAPSRNLQPKRPPNSVKASRTRKKIVQRKPFLQKPERVVDMRDLVYLEFLHKLRGSNGLRLEDHEVRYFKYFIGPGNNAGLVKRVMKKRWWWIACDSMKPAHFLWTSVKHGRALDYLPYSERNHLTFNEEYKSTVPSKHLKKVADEEDLQGYNRILHSPYFCFVNSVGEDIDNINTKVYNRLENNHHLCSKKRLFKNLSKHYDALGEDVFDILPLTFHIAECSGDPSFKEFKKVFKERERTDQNNLWIIKPGESTNRGRGITVTSSFKEIQEIVCYPSHHTYIIQKYLENPLLVHNRKFDIRCYGLLTCINGHMQGYYYREGYIRTSSSEYTLDSFSKFVHLTNDAIQKYSDDYGKFESGNKLSYNELQAWLKKSKAKVNFEDHIQPQIQHIVRETFRAVSAKLGRVKQNHSYELYGFDFMIDSAYKVWLIEVNTNPCLEESCGLLTKLLTHLLDNTFRIAVDPIFPPPDCRSKNLLNWVTESGVDNLFDLVFSEIYETSQSKTSC